MIFLMEPLSYHAIFTSWSRKQQLEFILFYLELSSKYFESNPHYITPFFYMHPSNGLWALHFVKNN